MLAHCNFGTAIADQQSGHNYRDRPRQMQAQRQRIGGGDDAHGQQDLQHVLVHGRHGPVGNPACHSPQYRTTQGLNNKQLAHLESSHLSARCGGRNGQQDDENNDPYPIVEQRFTGDLGFQRVRHVDRFQ